MDGLVRVLVLSLFTALAKSEVCSMVQKFDADVIFNQSNQLPPPLKQIHAKNSNICNSKCCALDGCNVAYFDTSKSGKYSCMMYSCKPTPTCGFYNQQGVQVFVNEADLPTNPYGSTTLSVTSTGEKEPEPAPIPSPNTVTDETPLPQMGTNGTTNSSQSSIQISKSTTAAASGTTLESHEIYTNGTTKNTPESSTHLSTSTTAASNNTTSESSVKDIDVAGSTSQSPTLNTTILNGRTSESSETVLDVADSVTVSQTPLHIASTPVVKKNDTSASPIDASVSDSSFRPPSSSASPRQSLSASLSEDSNHSISIPHIDNSSNTANDTGIQPTKTTDHSAPQMVNASSAYTSQNETTVLPSPVSTPPSTAVPNSNDTDSLSAILDTLTAIINSSSDVITSSYGSGDQIEPTSIPNQVTSDDRANDLTQLTSSSLQDSFDLSKYIGNIAVTEGPNIVPTTRSETVIGSSSEAVGGFANNGTQGSAATSGMPNVLKTLLLCSLAFGSIFILAVVGVLGKLVFDSYRKRHYSRLDYLINGMY